jgi:hypothetical protein
MKDKDDKTLEFLYEESVSKKTDYLVMENIEDFDWDYFWNRYIFCEQVFYTLFESFEKVKSSEKSDVYEIVTTNGLKFLGYINYLTISDIDNRFINTIVGNMSDREVLNALQEKIKETTQPILNVNFEDEENQTKITGKVGNYTFSVLSGIRQSIIDSLYNRKAAPDIMIVNINKNEPKRLEIYQKFFKRCFPKFKNFYIDKNFSADYDLVYIY